MSSDAVLADVLPGDDVVVCAHHVALQPVPRAAAEARRFVREHAPELPSETHDALLLLTSELVTNAVLHARTEMEVSVVVAERSVVVTVHDWNLSRPEQSPYPQREGGWGLELVSALAHSAAVAAHPDGGKTAWFRLLRGPAPHVADSAAARADSTQRDS